MACKQNMIGNLSKWRTAIDLFEIIQTLAVILIVGYAIHFTCLHCTLKIKFSAAYFCQLAGIRDESKSRRQHVRVATGDEFVIFCYFIGSELLCCYSLKELKVC